MGLTTELASSTQPGEFWCTVLVACLGVSVFKCSASNTEPMQSMDQSWRLMNIGVAFWYSSLTRHCLGVSLFSDHSFVLPWYEVFWDVLLWLQRIIFRSILVPPDDESSVSAIAFLSCNAVYRIFWRRGQTFASPYWRGFYFLLLRLVRFLGEPDVCAVLVCYFPGPGAVVTLCVGTVFRTRSSSNTTMCNCPLMIGNGLAFCGSSFLFLASVISSAVLVLPVNVHSSINTHWLGSSSASTCILASKSRLHYAPCFFNFELA